MVLVNPAPVSGNLDTEGTRTIAFENVRAVASESTNTRERWQDSLTFQDITTAIVSTADYNYNTDATLPPAIVTGESVYSAPDGSAISVSDQTLIDGNRIRLTFLTGNLSETGQDASVVVEPQSSSLRTVTLTGNESGDPIRLRLDPPPRLTADEWIAEYESQLTESSNRVTNVLNDNGDIVIELQASNTYHLQISSVKVGSERTEPERLDPAYIITHQGDFQSVDGGQNATLIAEVRDKFNNPVREANVTFEITSGDGVLRDEDGNTVTGTRTVSTDAEGRAVQRVLVKSIGENVIVNASIDGQIGALSTTEFTIQTPQETNPVELSGVRFEGSEAASQGNTDTVHISFSNVGNTDRNMTSFRLNFFQGDADPATGDIEGQSFTVGGAAITLDPKLEIPQGGSVVTFDVTFSENIGQADVAWFVMTISYGTGDTGQYFASASD